MSILDASRADQTVINKGPVVRELVGHLTDRFENEKTLLAICPNSELVTRAGLHAAKEADAPLLLAATLNQVDIDGGYTGWTPQTLVDFIAEESERIGLNGLILPCLDHGGPWLKDEHASKGYSYAETMEAVKRSLEACIEAGYALLHIDPTVDRTLPPGTPMPIELVVERTLELIQHSEAYRSRRGLPAISYEVGTEEVHGGLADMHNFDAFLSALDEGLRSLGLEHAWPAFVVGKVGTDLHTTYFEPTVAQELTRRVKPYGALIKGHYTDYVDNPEDYPTSGMGGANVGPEYTEEEYGALMDLVALERKLGFNSGLTEALHEAVVRTGRWKKWLQDDEPGAFEALEPSRQSWLIRTGSRYIWTDAGVVEARGHLYHNLRNHRDADAYVLWRVKISIMKYYHAFNLVGWNRELL